MWWNFVARSHDEIVTSRADWQAQLDGGQLRDGRFGVVAGESLAPIPPPACPTPVCARAHERAPRARPGRGWRRARPLPLGRHAPDEPRLSRWRVGSADPRRGGLLRAPRRGSADPTRHRDKRGSSGGVTAQGQRASPSPPTYEGLAHERARRQRDEPGGPGWAPAPPRPAESAVAQLSAVELRLPVGARGDDLVVGARDEVPPHHDLSAERGAAQKQHPSVFLGVHARRFRDPGSEVAEFALPSTSPEEWRSAVKARRARKPGRARRWPRQRWRSPLRARGCGSRTATDRALPATPSPSAVAGAPGARRVVLEPGLRVAGFPPGRATHSCAPCSSSPPPRWRLPSGRCRGLLSSG